jgi:hypothetical protein
LGIIIGTFFSSLNEIILFITGAFYGGYAAPNALKWIWSRFNGYGYFAGMLAGMFAAMVGGKVIKFLVKDFSGLAAMAETQALTLMSFVFIFLVSLAMSVIVSLLTPAVEEEVSERFYRKTRPWGFWKPVYIKIQKLEAFVPNQNFSRDAVNVVIGIAWQMSMVVLPLYVAFREWSSAMWTLLIFISSSVALKLNWYDKLEED